MPITLTLASAIDHVISPREGVSGYETQVPARRIRPCDIRCSRVPEPGTLEEFMCSPHQVLQAGDVLLAEVAGSLAAAVIPAGATYGRSGYTYGLRLKPGVNPTLVQAVLLVNGPAIMAEARSSVGGMARLDRIIKARHLELPAGNPKLLAKLPDMLSTLADVRDLHEKKGLLLAQLTRSLAVESLKPVNINDLCQSL